MASALLLLVVFVAWVLMLVAGLAGKAVEGARRSVPAGERRGVSIVPIIPVFPLALWGVALLVDLVKHPWGTWAVGSVHAVVAVVCVVSIVRDIWRLRTLDRPA